MAEEKSEVLVDRSEVSLLKRLSDTELGQGGAAEAVAWSGDIQYLLVVVFIEICSHKKVLPAQSDYFMFNLLCPIFICWIPFCCPSRMSWVILDAPQAVKRLQRAFLSSWSLGSEI